MIASETKKSRRRNSKKNRSSSKQKKADSQSAGSTASKHTNERLKSRRDLRRNHDGSASTQLSKAIDDMRIEKEVDFIEHQVDSIDRLCHLIRKQRAEIDETSNCLQLSWTAGKDGKLKGTNCAIENNVDFGRNSVASMRQLLESFDQPCEQTLENSMTEFTATESIAELNLTGASLEVSCLDLESLNLESALSQVTPEAPALTGSLEANLTPEAISHNCLDDKIITSEVSIFLPNVPLVDFTGLNPLSPTGKDNMSDLDELGSRQSFLLDDPPSFRDQRAHQNDGAWNFDDILRNTKKRPRKDASTKIPWLNIRQTFHDSKPLIHMKPQQDYKGDSSWGSSFAINLEEVIEQEVLEDTLLQNRRPADTIKLEDLKKHTILGEGIFGQVWMVTDSKVESRPYALKVQSKYELSEEKKLEFVLREKEAMIKIDSHPFILDLVKTFQDDHCLYFLMDLVQGGELFSLMHYPNEEGGDNRSLPEHQAKFYTLAIADALTHIHRANYIYRDLKSENILMDSTGYPVVIDFGCAKYLEDDDMAFTMIGTPCCVAPEVITTVGHNYSADLWSLGVLLYEMLFGAHPFEYENMSQMELFECIIEEDFKRPKLEEANVSEDAFDLVSMLLLKDPKERLDNKGTMNHVWFADLNLAQMRKRRVKAPWVPVLNGPLDASNFDDWSDLEDKTRRKYPALQWREVVMTEDF